MLTLLTAVFATLAASHGGTTAAEPLAWLPASTTTVMGGPRDKVPLLSSVGDSVKALSDALGVAPPRCWSKVMSPVVASYQIWAGAQDPETALLLQGAVDRDRAEACIEEMLRMFLDPPRLMRSGSMTRIETARMGDMYIGWSSSWVICHSDPHRVQELVSALGTNTLSPALVAVLARADRSAPLWFVTTPDYYSSGLLGVPAQAAFGAMVGAASRKPLIRVTFEYSSPDAVKLAALALKAAGSDPKLPAEVRLAARGLRSVSKGRFLTLEIDAAAWIEGSTLTSLQTYLEQKRNGPPKP